MRWVFAVLFAVTALSGAPRAQAAEGDLVIFLHNGWFEKHKTGKPHPKFGAYDFEGIKAALSKGGALQAPSRGPDAGPPAEAAQLVATIKAAIAGGTRPSQIKVIGTSKGGFIAQLASAELQEPEIRWVVVGACHNKRLAKRPSPAMTGKVLSIYDASDTVAGACAAHKGLYAGAAAFEEVKLSTGKDHGFQFTAKDAWITPALAW